jgi:processive 1,2-diacylglycerol beta-glucosyltransferase
MTPCIGTGRHELLVVGYTQQIDRYMSEADIFITKAGGLSTSESFACGTPLLLLPGRAGQEEDNCRFFDQRGAALFVNNLSDIPSQVNKIISSPQFKKYLTDSAIALGKPKAAVQAAEVVDKLLSGKQR